MNLSATGIGVILQGYQGSIKADGCPMISPTYPLYTDLSLKGLYLYLMTCEKLSMIKVNLVVL